MNRKFWKKNFKQTILEKNFDQKILNKCFRKKKFKPKILVTKIYNNINKCSTLAVLGASIAAVLRQHPASTPPVVSSQVSYPGLIPHVSTQYPTTTTKY